MKKFVHMIFPLKLEAAKARSSRYHLKERENQQLLKADAGKEMG